MKNKTGFSLAVIACLTVILACKQVFKVDGNDVSNAATDSSRTYTESGKKWDSYELARTDIKIDLPAKPGDKTPPLPANAKGVFSAMDIYAINDKDLDASASQLTPVGRRKWQIKDLADTSMASLKKQIPDLTYTVSTTSDTNAKYIGSFTRGTKKFDLRGCCVYKKTSPARIWAVMALYPVDNADAQQAGQRIIDSVVFKDSAEQCK